MLEGVEKRGSGVALEVEMGYREAREVRS
jgi:hypothetical protein